MVRNTQKQHKTLKEKLKTVTLSRTDSRDNARFQESLFEPLLTGKSSQSVSHAMLSKVTEIVVARQIKDIEFYAKQIDILQAEKQSLRDEIAR